MLAIRQKWDSMPPIVKKAIICLLVGWAAHYIFYFGFIAEDQSRKGYLPPTRGWYRDLLLRGDHQKVGPKDVHLF